MMISSLTKSMFPILLVATTSQLSTTTTEAFTFVSTGHSFSRYSLRTGSTQLHEGQMEQIEFKIFPDGRVEEIVRGVKGNNCNKVTEKINQALGEVILSQPTEEMFEQPIVLENTLTQTLGDIGGGDSWEGQSSW
mmetsp:Transcript_127888/g.368374  ORF Transcript_127888/g.368374 Transcript_127888/m.368374 type:complete len:135 (+) Transcript_127888:121-525(+)